MSLGKETIKLKLKGLMNDALETINADGSIKEVDVNLDKMEINFTFDTVVVPEDDYIRFSGY